MNDKDKSMTEKEMDRRLYEPLESSLTISLGKETNYLAAERIVSKLRIARIWNLFCAHTKITKPLPKIEAMILSNKQFNKLEQTRPHDNALVDILEYGRIVPWKETAAIVVKCEDMYNIFIHTTKDKKRIAELLIHEIRHIWNGDADKTIEDWKDDIRMVQGKEGMNRG